MSSYTTTVRMICTNFMKSNQPELFEKYLPLEAYDDRLPPDDYIRLAIPAVFDFTYPYYNAAQKNNTEIKVLKHFYLREIGLETPDLWRFYLNMKMNEIMPYYVELFRSADMILDPLDDVDYVRKEEGTAKGEAVTTGSAKNNTATTNTENSNSSGETSSTDAYQDTPQGALNGVASNEYLTNARINKDNTKSQSSVVGGGTLAGTSSNEGNDKHSDEHTIITTMRGKIGVRSKSKLLEEYRKTIINIDMRIIRDLEPLFMQIW